MFWGCGGCCGAGPGPDTGITGGISSSGEVCGNIGLTFVAAVAE
jgi:hypothetical protein